MDNISETVASQQAMFDGMNEFVIKEEKQSMIDDSNKNVIDASLAR